MAVVQHFFYCLFLALFCEEQRDRIAEYGCTECTT